MYDHYFECEIFENMKYLLEKESKLNEQKIQESKDIIAKMAKEIDELKRDKEDL